MGGFRLPDVQGFIGDMRAQGIHVGVNGRCAVDGEAWPCTVERRPSKPTWADTFEAVECDADRERVATTAEREVKRCRFGAHELICRKPAVWALRRGLARPSWWFYCGAHTYGRWLEVDVNGVERLMHWRAT